MKVDQRKSTGICIGVPHAGRALTIEWVFALLAQTFPIGMRREYDSIKGEAVAVARNSIAEMALLNNCKYLWFVDDDTIPPVDACRNLIYQLEQADDKVMAIGGIYTTKTEPSEPLIFMRLGDGPYWKWKVGEIFPCLVIGAGCMLIKTEVFQYLEKPWFKTTEGFCKDETEDAYFCQKVNDAGFVILAHGGVLCGHIDAEAGKIYNLPAGCYPLQPTIKG
jgi:hypothetical protein